MKKIMGMYMVLRRQKKRKIRKIIAKIKIP
jgi:hypothetical protein